MIVCSERKQRKSSKATHLIIELRAVQSSPDRKSCHTGDLPDWMRLCSTPSRRCVYLSAFNICNAHAVAINHFPSLPAGKQQNADYD